MSIAYRELTHLVERLHRRLLDVVRAELTRADMHDLNGVQALLLANVGESEIAVRDLVERGYYLGSNVSYNLRKLTDLGYLKQKPTRHDRRSVTVVPTDKAKRAIAAVRAGEAIHAERYRDALEGLSDTKSVCDALKQLEFVWTENLSKTG
ncbi:MAG: winged helix DNA-binding protein [Rhodospirillales bacterium]